MKAKLFLAVGAVAFLGACANMNIDGVRNMPASGGSFDAALQAHYADLAQMEYDEADWSDARYFTNRAKMAAAGADNGPQLLADRDLPEDSKAELGVARADLVAALEGGAKTTVPQDAAHAQAMLDCWLQEQEENFQPEDIAWCRDRFYQAMTLVQAALAPVSPMTETTPMDMPVPMNVYFAFNSAEIDGKAQAVINGILEADKKFSPKKVKLTAYTDRAGDATYNDILAKSRVDAVAKALWSNGIRPARLEISISGEADVPVPTADGVREQGNRVVVVEFTNDM
ncbi:OmpA family protein [Thalassospira sp.]|uniref:OmpA family protein n=1 Tax=Thalassospira sp. TaxID=1912094 RepID=UPI00273447E9|nr:OmpA family protein [Thalassospira sp.]MDP2696492.1 OmpA family protein [Thalassospira sp.]